MPDQKHCERGPKANREGAQCLRAATAARVLWEFTVIRVVSLGAFREPLAVRPQDQGEKCGKKLKANRGRNALVSRVLPLGTD